MAQTLYLLDAYALIYRAYFAFASRPLSDARGRDTTALFGFALTLQDLIDKEQPDLIAIAMDLPGGTFRHEEFEDYKANRPETPDAIRTAIPYIKELIKAYRIPLIGAPGYEADDVIGTLARQAESQGYEVRMVTPDKDYGQLVTPSIKMISPNRSGSGFKLLGEAEIIEKYGIRTPMQVIDYLGLMGDKSDNVPGCPGIGKVAASHLLQEFGSIEDMYDRISEVKPTYAKKLEAGREQAFLSKHLVTIVTDVPDVYFNAEEMRWTGFDRSAVETLFKEFEFNSLLRRINKSSDAPAATLQPSLFDTVSQPKVESKTEESFSPLENYRTVGVHFRSVEGAEAIAQLAAELSSAQVLAFDTETDGLDSLSAHIVGMSLCGSTDVAYYIPLPEDADEVKSWLAPLRALFENREILKVAHNAKFDLEVLTRYGMPEAHPLYDTMLAHYLLDADQSHSLDNLANGLLRYDTIRYEALSPVKNFNLRHDVSPELLRDYAAEDAYVTYRLHESLSRQLTSPAELRLLNEVEVPLMYVLMRMEQRGISLDIDALEQSKEELAHTCMQLEQKIQSYAQEGVSLNVNSPKQIGELLFDRLQLQQKPKKTKTGSYVTNEETLVKLRHLHPVIGLILDYREARKLLNTYIEPLPKMVYPDGKIHTTYNQAVASTGRLSSSNPNLQNIPIRSDLGRPMRRAFVADPYYTPKPMPGEESIGERPYIGAKLLSADYSQVELRMIAHLSGDQNLIEAFLSGHDIHTATAAKIFKVPVEEVTPLMRSKAKTANFGINYGITSYGLSQRLDIPVGEAAELIDGYFETFPRVKSFMEEAKEAARATGYAETAFGRRRYLRGLLTARGSQLGYEERNAINAPIQGTAADVIKMAMVRIDRELRERRLRSFMMLQVHDELVLNVYDDETDEVMDLVRTSMQQAWPECRVPLLVEMGLGDNWLEAH